MANSIKDETSQYLIVAHYDGDHQVVQDLIHARSDRGPAHFVVLVPATPPRGRTLTWTEEQARTLAGRRLDGALHSLRQLGADVSGEIGADSIGDAVEDTLRTYRFDELVIATPAPSIREKLFGDLATSIAHSQTIPVTHVIIPGARAL